MNTVDAILDLSGPFMNAGAKARYRKHLEGLAKKNAAQLLEDLQKEAGRPTDPRAERAWQPARQRQNFHHA